MNAHHHPTMSNNLDGNSLKRPRIMVDGDGRGKNNGDTSQNTKQQTDEQQHHGLTIPSSDVIRLIMAHLTECGLHESTRMIQQESGIGCAGSSFQSQDWIRYASTGQWGIILQQLSLLDRNRIYNHTSQQQEVIDAIAAVHEMTILELADIGEWETAFSMFRLLQQDEEISSSSSEIAAGATVASTSSSSPNISISRSLEQKLAHLMAEREKDPNCTVPNDYYGSSSTDSSNSNQQIRRDVIGRRLQSVIPIQPSQRLPTLLQQAIKWQTYTGQIPRVRRAWDDEEQEGVDGNKEHHAKDKRKRTKKVFDLVLGEVSVDDSIIVGSDLTKNGSKGGKPISGIDYATIKFGKNAYAEVMCFLPDGSGIVTGSSDGLVEVWDNEGRLRTNDLVYQQNDELMGHDTGATISALAISNDTTLLASGASDGVVHIWRFDTGKCLRTISTSADHRNNGVACLCFSPDSSHILAGNNDGICREFGLRTSRMLKEFRGHTSYITSCYYHLQQPSPSHSDNDSNETLQLLVITASGDGTVRIWDGKTMDTISVFRPISVGLRNMLSHANTSIATIDIERLNQTASNEGSPTIHTILKLHTPIDTMIIVPRGQRAFMVDVATGRVLRTYEDDSKISSPRDELCFVAATVSSTNRWLYLVREDGICCIFDVLSGTIESTIPDFGPRCISSISTAAVTTEISSMAHHPTNGIIAAFSNNKIQKRGKVVLWK